ncbi:hypothetical protein ACFQY9_27580 [Microvirga aerilata]
MGLTGSARLLADLYQLEQYAFLTNKRKLPITKTVSLAQLMPAEFQQFRETGVIRFNTPLELFDRDFPGHYLRLIQGIRTSVIALVPPIDGIHATLASTGISRVVIGPDVFQTVTIRRDPEIVALSAPIGSTGAFELSDQSGMSPPFAGNGVDCALEFRMLKASNRLDFLTCMDVLVTYEYLSLPDTDYAQQVIRRLGTTLRAEVGFSLRNHFPDAWYDLHNAELLAEPERMVVQLRIDRRHFDPNLDRIRIEHVRLSFDIRGGAKEEVRVASLKLIDEEDNETVGLSAMSIDRTIDTRRGNGAAWAPLTGGGAGSGGIAPFGVWELSLRNGNAAEARRLKDLFDKDLMEDISLVIGYAADTSAFPA